MVCDAAALVRSPAYASPLSERPLFAAGCCVGVGVGVGVALTELGCTTSAVCVGVLAMAVAREVAGAAPPGAAVSVDVVDVVDVVDEVVEVIDAGSRTGAEVRASVRPASVPGSCRSAEESGLAAGLVEDASVDFVVFVVADVSSADALIAAT